MSEEEIPLFDMNPQDLATIDKIPIKLLSLLEEKNITKFTQLLEDTSEIFDVNHVYGDPHNGTLLDIACRSKGNHEFVKILIQHDAEINSINRISGKAPIHEVVENSDIETLNVLLKNITCDVNLIDENNMTPAMRAAFVGRADMLANLMKNEKVSFQPVNNRTILHSLIDGWGRCGSSWASAEKGDEFYLCLKSILECFPGNGFHLIANVLDMIQQGALFPSGSPSDERDHRETIGSTRATQETREEEPESLKSTSSIEPSSTSSERYNRTSISPHKQSSTSRHQPQPDNRNDDPSDPSSEQMQLLISFQQNNLDKFVNVLTKGTCSNIIDVNYYYNDPENGILLDIICRTKGNSEFAKKLIMNGAWVNFRNKKHHGKTPLHTTIEYSDETTLQILLSDPTCDVNMTDNHGNTALHLAALRNNIPAVEILLQHSAMDINQRNSTCDAALNIALNRNHKEVIREILKSREVDLEFGKDLQGRSCGVSIREKYPQMNVASFGEMNDRNRELFSLLYKGDTGSFIEQVSSTRYQLNNEDNDGFYTYLQYACNRGFVDVVDKLLALETLDPNYTCPNNTQTPIMIAAEKGHHKTVSRLLKDSRVSLAKVSEEGSVLHSLVRGMLYLEDTNELNDKSRNHHKCLEHILNKSSQSGLDINSTDRDGNTALYYAVKVNDKKAILLLLEAGSYVCHKNHTGDTILQSIHHKILEEYLESCVSTNGVSSKQTDHQIILNVRIFRPPDDRPEVPEIEPLLVLNKVPQSRYLLQHSVLTSFLNLKWQKTKLFYYINLIFYIIFWAALNGFIFYTYTVRSLLSSSSGNQTRSERSEKLGHDLSGSPVEMIEFVVRIAIASLESMLVFRQLFQLYASPWKYLISLENWLEICLIIATTFFLSFPSDENLNRQVAAVIIIASWMELILLIGRHPSLSTTTEIFKTVTMNFLKLLRYYGILIVAFAFCFHTLKKHSPDAKTGNLVNQPNTTNFNDLGKTFFTSFLMLTTINDKTKSVLEDNSFNIINYLLFVLCFFLVTIVLYNLLNGLAVTDIRNIKKNAQLLGIVSRMRFIWYIEITISTLDPNPIIRLAKGIAYYCRCYCCCCCKDQQQQRAQQPAKKYIKLFRNTTHLFPNTLPDCKIRVLPNKRNSILLAVAGDSNDSRPSHSYPILRHFSWKIDSDIVKQAKETLQKLDQQTDFNYAELLTKHTKKVQEFEQNLKRTELKLEEEVVKLRTEIKSNLERIEQKLDKEVVKFGQEIVPNLKRIEQKLDEQAIKHEPKVCPELEKTELILHKEAIPFKESDKQVKESDTQVMPQQELRQTSDSTKRTTLRKIRIIHSI